MTLATVRHPFTSLVSITLLVVAAGTAGAATSNIDPELQLVPDDLVLRGEVLSKLIDQGRTRVDDATAHFGGDGRLGWEGAGSKQGIGAHVNSYFALGEDQSQNPKVAPGECVELEGKIDYIYEAMDEGDVPFFQIIPHYEFITYPNAAIRQNYLKWRQSWVGADFWWCTPLDGVEVGGGADWTLAGEPRLFRGAFGAREFYQDAPFDLATWQLLNGGNKAFKHFFGGDGTQPPITDVEKGGFTTLDVGGKVTLPLPWSEFWTYTQADWIYWVDSKDRQNLQKRGEDVGSFVIAVGVEWRPE
jgi:hypothetical protein